MGIDADKYYFAISFRFNKTKPEEFGLKPAPGYLDLFIDESDNSSWKSKRLYDFGWGNEIGFLRLPELAADELWYLLMNSAIKDNLYGAAHELREKYPEELLGKFEELLAQTTPKNVTEEQKKVFRILELDQPFNWCPTHGKTTEQINQDFEPWKAISAVVKSLQC